MASKKTIKTVKVSAPKSAGKPPLTICHMADVHLGYRRYSRLTQQGLNQREVDISQAFSEAITRIISLRPDISIIAGDLFHTVRPSNTVIAFAFRELKRLAKLSGAPVVILAGNHESPKRTDTGSVLKILAEIPGVYIADSAAQRFEFPQLNLAVLCLPHTALAGLDRRTVRADDRYIYNVLALHAQVDKDWISDFGGVEMSLGALSPNEWDYIALGHVHVFKEMAYNAAYSGSTEHTAAGIWGEAERNKGFLQISFPEGKKTFHALSTPREVLVLEAVEAGGIEPQKVNELIVQALESAAGGVEGKIVKLSVKNLSLEVYRQLDHKMLRQWRNRCLNLNLDIQQPAAVGISSAGLVRKGKLDDELKDFCREYPAQLFAGEEIQGKILGYLEKLEEQHEAREASTEAVSPAS